MSLSYLAGAKYYDPRASTPDRHPMSGRPLPSHSRAGRGVYLSQTFYICVGASGAQGLQDIRALLKALSSDLNAVVLLVLHRPSDQPSYLREVLSLVSRMPVLVAQNYESLDPGICYIGEPAQHLTLTSDGLAKLVDGAMNEYRNRTVDLLFESIAENAGPYGIGVVLSGGLKDGTRGLAAIKAHGGSTVVLHPSGSKMESGMPGSAIAYNRPVDCVGTITAIVDEIERLVPTRDPL